MDENKPIKLYFLITIVSVIALIYIGLLLRNFISERFPAKNSEVDNGVSKQEDTDEFIQAKAIFAVAGVVALIMALSYLVLKIGTGKFKKKY